MRGVRICVKDAINILNEINPNISILNEVDLEINTHSYLDCKCLIDGHEWSARWGNLKYKRGCPKCRLRIIGDKKRKYSIEKIKILIKDINPNIEIFEDKCEEYKNTRSVLGCKCLIDGYEWNSNWNNLSSGEGCTICGRKRTVFANSKGGVSSLSKYLRGNIEEWKQDSIRYCNYKCDITGLDFDVVHHVHKGFDAILREVLEISGLELKKDVLEYTQDELSILKKISLELHYKYGLGVTMCEKEHKLFHSTYGYGNNTFEQYEEFKNSRWRNNILPSESAKEPFIVCLNTRQAFNSISGAASKYNLDTSSISKVCKHKLNHVKGYSFMYYEEYKNLTEEEILKLSDISNQYKPVRMSNEYADHLILCVTTGEIFKTFYEAGMEYGLKEYSLFVKCCLGESKSYGVHNRKALKWEFI